MRRPSCARPRPASTSRRSCPPAASSSPPSPPTRDPMSETQAELGAEMQAARRAHGWELPQLAASLRIRQSYLEAIEAGRLADLPGTTYALGFVRAYASALGLPGEEMARRFRADATLANGQTALRFPAPVPQRGLPAGALMLLGVFILAASYGGWYWITEHRATPVETVPPIPDAMVSETQKPVPSPQVASLLPNTAPPAPAPTPAAPAAVTTPGASGSPAAGTTSSAPSAAGLSAAGANGPSASGPPAGARDRLDQASPSGAASSSAGTGGCGRWQCDRSYRRSAVRPGGSGAGGWRTGCRRAAWPAGSTALGRARGRSRDGRCLAHRQAEERTASAQQADACGRELAAARGCRGRLADDRQCRGNADRRRRCAHSDVARRQRRGAARCAA